MTFAVWTNLLFYWKPGPARFTCIRCALLKIVIFHIWFAYLQGRFKNIINEKVEDNENNNQKDEWKRKMKKTNCTIRHITMLLKSLIIQYYAEPQQKHSYSSYAFGSTFRLDITMIFLLAVFHDLIFLKRISTDYQQYYDHRNHWK